ncbi:nuclear transport factor 2 family protein [Thermodesulfobacteriota bacterium]
MTLEELKKRVKVLQDIEEIKKMHRDYIFWLSEQNWDDMTECFAENAIIKIGVHGAQDDNDEAKGKKEINRIFKDVIGKRALEVKPKGGHILLQPVITVEGDRAKGHWDMNRFVYNPDAHGGPAPEMGPGRYDCEYIREGGKWKISNLKWIHPFPKPPGSSEGKS